MENLNENNSAILLDHLPKYTKHRHRIKNIRKTERTIVQRLRLVRGEETRRWKVEGKNLIRKFSGLPGRVVAKVYKAASEFIEYLMLS